MAQPFRDNPDRVLPLSVDPAAPDRDAALLAVARRVVPSWAGANRCDVAQVHGGITNLLFRLRCGELEPLLVRVYGAHTEAVIDREAENRLFAALSRRGVAPTYHGRFANGRIEGWWDGFRALAPSELGQPALRRRIAVALAAFHTSPLPSPEPRLWTTLLGWMETARTLDFDGPQRDRWAALDLDRAAGVLARLRAHERDVLIPGATGWGARHALRSVCAHNDLLAGNILVNGAQDEVRFIDFEYGSTAPAGFDVANHFCEYAGFDSDFERGFPSRPVRNDFIAAYLGPGASADDARDFSRVVDFYVLPDHLWWGTWAVVQARHSVIDFDYLDYARLRLAGLWLHLDELGPGLGLNPD